MKCPNNNNKKLRSPRGHWLWNIPNLKSAIWRLKVVRGVDLRASDLRVARVSLGPNSIRDFLFVVVVARQPAHVDFGLQMKTALFVFLFLWSISSAFGKRDSNPRPFILKHYFAHHQAPKMDLMSGSLSSEILFAKFCLCCKTIYFIQFTGFQ